MKWVLSKESSLFRGITEREVAQNLHVPIKSWCEDVENSALQQMGNICRDCLDKERELTKLQQ